MKSLKIEKLNSNLFKNSKQFFNLKFGTQTQKLNIKFSARRFSSYHQNYSLQFNKKLIKKINYTNYLKNFYTTNSVEPPKLINSSKVEKKPNEGKLLVFIVLIIALLLYVQDENKNNFEPFIEKALVYLYAGKTYEALKILLTIDTKDHNLEFILKYYENEDIDLAYSLLNKYCKNHLQSEELIGFLDAIYYNSIHENDKSINILLTICDRTNNDLFRSLAYYHLSLIDKNKSDIYYDKAKAFITNIGEYKFNIDGLRNLVESYRKFDLLKKKNHDLDKLNRVTVYVWMHKDSLGKDFGHCSMSTRNNYISFHPVASSNEGISYIENKGGYLSLLQDIGTMRRLPDARLSLYKFDSGIVNTKFNEFKSKNSNWSLLSTFINSKNQSCSGLILSLLILADSNKYIDTEQTSTSVGKFVSGALIVSGIIALSVAEWYFTGSTTYPKMGPSTLRPSLKDVVYETKKISYLSFLKNASTYPYSLTANSSLSGSGIITNTVSKGLRGVFIKTPFDEIVSPNDVKNIVDLLQNMENELPSPNLSSTKI